MSPAAFAAKKKKILQQLSVPDGDYTDLSPKGSVDEGIRTLIQDINAVEGLVTTSSCAGRISVYLDGLDKNQNVVNRETELSSSATGGKGGGKWLFVSHDPLAMPSDHPSNHFLSQFNMKASRDKLDGSVTWKRLIHFKFEAMILHMLVSSLEDAQRVLTAALTAGFRESGAIGLSAAKDGTISPMIAVRSTGLGMESIVGYEDSKGGLISLVDEEYLHKLVSIANERFQMNTERIERFRTGLLDSHLAFNVASTWEDPDERKRRKREEGLKKQDALKAKRTAADNQDGRIEDLAGLDGVFGG